MLQLLFNTLVKIFSLLVALSIAWPYPAFADHRPGLIALVHNQDMEPVAGRYDALKGWMPSTAFFDPPDPGFPVTLFGLGGKIAEVSMAMEEKIPADYVFKNWNAPISAWTHEEPSTALAVTGRWPAPVRLPQLLPLNDPTAVAVARDYLAEHHLKVENPRLTQAMRIDLLGDGHEEIIVTAYSDPQEQVEGQPATIYALSLLAFSFQGRSKIVALAEQAGYKPAEQSLDAFKHYQGVRGTFNVLAFVDLTGRGPLTIALSRHYPVEIAAMRDLDIFTFDGKAVKKVLSGEKY